MPLLVLHGTKRTSYEKNENGSSCSTGPDNGQQRFASDITRKGGGGTSIVKCAVFQSGFSAPYYSFALNSLDVTRTTPLTAPTIVYFADEASDRFNGLLGTNLVDISTNPSAPTVFSKVVNTPTPHIVQVSAWRVGYNIFFSVI